MQVRKRFLAALLSTAMLISQISVETVWAAANQEQENQRTEAQTKILELSFDGEDGLISPGTKVTMNGTLAFSEDVPYSGQSLEFDGNASNYLSVTDAAGGNLLKGYDNLTISYWSKTPQTAGCNWAAYLAPDANQVNGNAPTYLAVSDQANMRVERYRSGRSTEVTGKGIADTWKMVTVVIKEAQTTMYINGKEISSVSNANTLSSIVGENGIFYIGRANWGNGEGFTGLLDQYAVYNYAMDAGEVQKAYKDIVLSNTSAEKILQGALDEIHIPELVTGNLTLPAENENGVTYEWTSDNEAVINTKAAPCAWYYNEVDIPAGVVTRQKEDTAVTLRVKVSYNGTSKELSYPVTVKAASTQEEYVGYLYAHFNEHPGAKYDGIQQIFFGISKNGVDWTALNNNQFVAESNVGDYGVRDPYIIRSAEGDKFYLIATDLDIDSYKYGGNWGLMASQGSQGLVIWESNDLVNWSQPRLVDVASEINAGMAWAPEAIYDEATGEYLVFWSSSKTNGKCNYIYVAKTRDFWTFTEPELYSNASNLNDGTPDKDGNPRGNIDASIYKEGDTYYRLIKDESDVSIRLQSSKKLLAYGQDLSESDYVSVTKDETKKMPNRGALFQKIDNEGTITVTDKNGNSVQKPCLEQFARNYEGPTMFKFNDREEWCILVDEYGRGAVAGSGNPRGYIPFISKDLDQPNSVYLPSDDEFVMPDAAKHGTVIPITQTEYDALMKKWGTPKQEGNQKTENKPVLEYDFETVDGKIVKDSSATGAQNNGTLNGTAAVTEVSGKGKALYLDGSGSLSFPQGFFDGLSNMTLTMDVCSESDEATVFSMGSTVKNKISSYTVSGGASGEVVTQRDRYWEDPSQIANKYLNLNLAAQSVKGQITTFNDYGMFEASSANNQSIKGNWKNVALVMDGHVMSVYVDNQLVAQHKHVRSVEELGEGLTAVLGAAYGKDNGFKGYIDNVKVYNRSVEDLANPVDENIVAAENVMALIGAIGKVSYPSSKAKIEEARNAYNALTKEQKALVTNLTVLTEAETAYAELERAANAKIEISKAKIGVVSKQNYTGKEVKPKLSVTYNSKKLKAGTDYTVTYSNNKKIGTAKATVTGKGKYTGTVTKKFQITVFKGKSYTVSGYKYKMTGTNTAGKGTVSAAGAVSKSIKQIKVSDTVTIGGKKFKVTAIADQAFKGCKKASSAVIGKNVKTIGKQSFMNCTKLKKITVNTTGLKKVGKDALRGIHKQATIKVPSKQLSKYKKLFNGKGQGKKVKIKK